MMRRIKRAIRFHTMLIRYVLTLLLVTTLAIAPYMYVHFSKVLAEQSIQDRRAALSYCARTVGEYLRNIENMAAAISENRDIIEVLADDYPEPSMQVVGISRMAQLLSSFAYYKNSVAALHIVTPHFSGTAIRPGNGIIPEDALPIALADLTYKVADSGWRVDLPLGDASQQSVHSVQFFKNIYYKNSYSRLGTLIISVEEPTMRGMLVESFFGEAGAMSLVDERGYVISHPDAALVGTLFKAGLDETYSSKTHSITLSRPVERTSWRLIQPLDIQAITRDVDKYMRTQLLILLGVVAFATLAAVNLSFAVTNPLTDLVEAIARAGRSEFAPNPKRYHIVELNALNDQFNQMVGNIERLLEQIAIEQERKRVAELELLQAQINPHFIYNTIELINWVAAKNGDTKVCEIAHALGTMFRTALNEGLNMMSVRSEIEHVKNYLMLQDYKYEHSFQVIWHVNEEALMGYIPKLVLQPLVENSISHGFRRSRGAGTIWISVEHEATDILLTVEDNGAGLDEATMKKLTVERGVGYGVYNVHERIVHRFGKGYGLSFSLRDGGGTRAQVRIPNLSYDQLEEEERGAI